MMKYALTLLSIFAVFGVIAVGGEEILPPLFNFDRYSAMVKNSPFAIATAAAVPAETPNFAKDLYVANAAHSPEADMATIASISDQNFKKYLTTREPMDGYGLASIQWSERVGETKVTISKGGKFATLTFNEALLSQAIYKARPASGPSRAGVSLVPPSMSRQVQRHGVNRQNHTALSIAKPNLAPIPTPNSSHVPTSNAASAVTPEQQEQQEQQMQQQLQQKMQERLAKEPAQPEGPSPK